MQIHVELTWPGAFVSENAWKQGKNVEAQRKDEGRCPWTEESRRNEKAKMTHIALVRRVFLTAQFVS
jgi:hypothetical protein